MILLFGLMYWAYAKIQTSFNASATELKRIDSITKSPLFTAFSQTIDGLASIRAHRLEKHLVENTTEAIDVNTANYLTWAHSNR